MTIEQAMDAREFTRLCKRFKACREGLDWIAGKSLKEFWATCERADWMLWLCEKLAGEKGWPKRQKIVLVACLCAERALPIFEKKYPKDGRPRKAIEAARAWAQETGTKLEARRAAAAYDAADTAYADAYATDADAAYAACKAGCFAEARAKEFREMAAIVRENLDVPS